MPAPGSKRLSRQLALASVGTAVAVGVVCAVGLFTLGHVSEVARRAVSRELKFADDTAATSAFLYQKGLVAEYLLTGSRHWLADLEASRPAFESWLQGAHARVATPEGRRVLDELQAEYSAFDGVRRLAIERHDAGQTEEAKATLEANRQHAQRLRDLFGQLGSSARSDAASLLEESERSVRILAGVLVATSLAGVVASLFVGFFWARRLTRPIYELEVQVEAAAERTKIQLRPGREGVEALGEQIRALIAKFEETDAALAEHRRRLIQSEKLSAVGEVTAKLAHEVLNPLAGIKAAIQLFARQGAGAEGSRIALVGAIDHEVSRVDGLLRRLMRFSRPLAPRFQVVMPGTIVDDALAAAAPDLERCHAVVHRTEDLDLPPLEADPLLLAQALLNLLKNAAEALPEGGGPIWIHSGQTRVLGREEVYFRVTDRGRGIEPSTLPQLFKPFVTTKAEGHGLGLAVSQNIVLEHGGTIQGRNLTGEEGSGARFEISLPIVR